MNDDLQNAIDEAVDILQGCPEDTSSDELNAAINEALEVLSKFKTK